MKRIFTVFGTFLDCKTPPEIQHVAMLAREAFARGEVALVQRRTEGKGGQFQYIALKRRERRTPIVNGEACKTRIRGWRL
jgi:hypothetical protein